MQALAIRKTCSQTSIFCDGSDSELSLSVHPFVQPIHVRAALIMDKAMGSTQ